MADQGKTDQHSSLELLKHDSTANAPERDRSAEAPELDPYILAPEGVPDTGPQAIALDEQVEKQALKSHKATKINFVSRKNWLVLCVGLAIIAIGVGVGVGVGISTRGSTTLTPVIPTASATISPTSLTHGILDDSSFAAVTAPGGDRYVFFQDINGSLRQALYSPTTLSWTADIALIIPGSADARNNTPLSATINIAIDDSDEIFLFYISKNNSLTAKWYVSGSWASTSETEFVNLASFIASPYSRSLSIGIIPNSSTRTVCLLFEESGSNVTALFGMKHLGENSHNGLSYDLPYSPNKPLWTWQNVTRNVTSLSIDSAWSSPFTTSLLDSIYGPVLDVLFYSPRAIDPFTLNTTPTVGVLWSPYFNKSFSLNALPSSDIPPDLFPTEDISVKTDLLKAVTYLSTNLSGNYMLWVNATTLVTVNFGPIGEGRLINEPLSSFPFGRMATTTPVGSRAFYLYHQLNGSILAEEVWDSGHLVWTSSNVSVAIT